jgi:uncharacterized surface anchored protein
MSLEFKKQTDQEHKETLASKIVMADWGQKVSAVGDKVKFFVQTHFVGNGSEIEIDVEDKKGKKVEKLKGQVFGDQFAGSIVIPDKAKEEITFTAKLAKHGLTMKSGPMAVFNVKVTNMKWGQKEAREGDVVKLSADIDGVPDETEVMIKIYEYDRDGAHDFITKFPCRVKNKKIEAEWEYEYHEDTDEIPTHDEMQKYGKSYNPPEYFFVIDVHGRRFGDKQESGLLIFKDWIQLEACDELGDVLSNANFQITLADGTEVKGKLDENGAIRIDNLSPGQYTCEIEIPDE